MLGFILFRISEFGIQGCWMLGGSGCLNFEIDLSMLWIAGFVLIGYGISIIGNSRVWTSALGTARFFKFDWVLGLSLLGSIFRCGQGNQAGGRLDDPEGG